MILRSRPLILRPKLLFDPLIKHPVLFHLYATQTPQEETVSIEAQTNLKSTDGPMHRADWIKITVA